MKVNPHKYPFIVFEGIDGCGKGEQIERLKKHFESRSSTPHFTKEPVEGPGKIGTLIRNILNNKGVVINEIEPISDSCGKADEIIGLISSKRGRKLTNEELQLLYIADRILHRHGERGFLQHSSVISDRDWESTLAYYSAFGGHPRWVIDKHEEIFAKAEEEFFISDLTIIIDITAEEAIKRQQEMGKTFDYFEDAIEKRERIRQAYLELSTGLKWALDIPVNIQVVDGMRAKEDVFEDVLRHVNAVFENKLGA